MRQRGFTLYIVLAALLAFSGMAVALKVQSSRLEACKQEFATFKADVQAKGEAAQREAAVKNAENAKRKEKSDAERKRLIAANTNLADRLRDNAARSSLPEISGTAGVAETACFRRTDLDAAIRKFTAGTAGIAAAGDAALADLDNARRWAQ
jgi:DNA-binding helix-hairpin-helix protein with protein kinase domain